MSISVDLQCPLLVDGHLLCNNDYAQGLHQLKGQLVSLHRSPKLLNEPCRVGGCTQFNLKTFVLASSVKHCKKFWHLSGAVITSRSCRRHSRKSSCPRDLLIKTCCHRLHDSSLHRSLSMSISSSSGQSSPTFSSRTSSSTRSPPSSQSSIADLSSSSSLPFIRPQPRIQISSLLADPHTRTYHLEIVQHPLCTAEFGTSYLSRVPLTPPIIAQLIVRDSSGNSVIPEAELPFLVAHLSLFSGDGLTALDMGSFIGSGVTQNPPPLYGNLVSTVEQLEDLQGNMGLFFLFPDVSIRSRGRYQLGITLTRIASAAPSGLSERGTSLARTRTRPFDAVPLHEYIAAPPTRLTQSFIRQGARMFSNTPYQPTR